MSEIPRSPTPLDPRVMDMKFGGPDQQKAAFTSIYGEFTPAIRKYAKRMRSDRSDVGADDIAQETMLRAWNALPNFKSRSKLSSWIFTIATNLMLDNVRRQTRQPSFPLDMHVLDPFHRMTSVNQPSSREPSEILETDEILDVIFGSMERKLNPDQRDSVLSRDLFGLSYPEISQNLGRSLASTKFDIHSGRKLIAAELVWRGLAEPEILEPRAKRGAGQIAIQSEMPKAA